MTLLGSGALNATGNDLGNVLIGNSGNNILAGGAGADTLNGNWGADTMFGGTGNDIYVVDNVGDVVNETGATARTRCSRGSASVLPIRCMPLARSRI